MPEYIFIDHPDSLQEGQIRQMYLQEGWWDERDERDDRDVHLIEKIVRGSHCFIVAREAGEIIGMGRAISDNAADAYIHDVAVRKNERGRGIATEIVTRLIARLHADGITWIGLIAVEKSHRLYEKAGFAALPGALPMLHRHSL